MFKNENRDVSMMEYFIEDSIFRYDNQYDRM